MNKVNNVSTGKKERKFILGAVIFGTFAVVLTIFVISPTFEDFLTNFRSFLLAYFLWLFFLFVLLACLMIYLFDRKILPSLWRNLRPFRTIHFVLMVIIGLVVADNLDFFNANNAPYIIIVLFLLVFLWQYTVMINDIYDLEIDELSNIKRPLVAGVVTKKQYTYLVVAMALFSGLFGFLLSPVIFAFALFCLFLGTIYSVPPFRVRDRIWSSSIIGLGSSFAFLIGFFTPNFQEVTPDITSNTILIALIIFSALSVAPILTDFKDYEGDKKAGVKSLYTVFGLEKGKKIASALIPIMFLIPIIIFQGFLDVLIFIIFGSIATTIFYKKGDFRGVFGCYFIVLIYCILRFVDILSGGL